MDTLTAPPPVAAPAAVTPAPTNPAAAPAETPKTPINSVTGKPISEAAHNLFKMLEESGNIKPDEPEQKVEPKAEAAPAATPEASPAPAKEAAPEKPIKVSKRPVKRPELPIPKLEPPAATATGAAPAASAPPDSKWEESLLDDEKAALEDARFAEKVDPKFKGLSDKMGAFFRAQKEYLEQHPDADENDAGYKKILATQPALSIADKRLIADARVEERVSSRVNPKIEELEQQIFVRDEEPKIENEAQQIRHYLAFNALPKEMLDTLRAKGKDALMKEYGDELEVASGLINTFVDDAKELIRITKLNPRTGKPLQTAAMTKADPNWEQHSRIALLVNTACEDFHKNAPQSEQVRDGKWFVTREEWLGDEEHGIPGYSRFPDKYWTFTNKPEHVREMINRALAWQPDFIASELKKREERLNKRGWVKQRATPEPKIPPSAPPVPSSSPSSPRPSPTPPPSSTPGGQKTPGQLLAARLSAEQ